ncbi:MAG: class III poly(R)-hydroxyalkanoic acid synthase subunit PhaE [Alphaproteobacteria bacterium]|nr:MAG: class III poly(R)-hydroxyalkanoic acid synthase subunit PhaE [Alphaproteobacteria bacterium]
MTAENIFTNNEWFEAQRKFWDGWMKIAREATEKAESSADSRANDDALWQQFYPWTSFPMQETPPAAQDILQKMLAAQEQYFNMVQHFSGASADGLNLSKLATDWVNYMTSSYNNAQQHSLGSHGALWDLFQDTWARTASSLSPFPGDFFRGVRPEGETRGPGDIHGHLSQFLATPSVGYSRETQGQYQKLSSLWLDYQRSMFAYNAQIAKVNQDALKLFQQKISELADIGPVKDGADAVKKTAKKALTTVKDIYDLWVDACEEVYADFAMSDEYTTLYGNLVNALMALKKQMAVVSDEMFEAMNMPTHKEVNTLHKRVHEARREHRRMQDKLEDLEDLRSELGALKELKAALKEVDSLRKEVGALKDEVKALKAPAKTDTTGKKGK